MSIIVTSRLRREETISWSGQNRRIWAATFYVRTKPMPAQIGGSPGPAPSRLLPGTASRHCLPTPVEDAGIDIADREGLCHRQGLVAA